MFVCFYVRMCESVWLAGGREGCSRSRGCHLVGHSLVAWRVLRMWVSSVSACVWAVVLRAWHALVASPVEST